jgi:hypothetical protein
MTRPAERHKLPAPDAEPATGPVWLADDDRWGLVHAFPATTNGPSNGICRSVGFMTMRPTAEVQVIAGLMGNIEDHYPDLRGGHDTVSVPLWTRMGARFHSQRARPLHAKIGPCHNE